VSLVLFDGEDSDGRAIEFADEGDGTLSVSIFAPGQENTDWTVRLDDDGVSNLQLTLAAYLHQKRE
jgi:hypothetical protein